MLEWRHQTTIAPASLASFVLHGSYVGVYPHIRQQYCSTPVPSGPMPTTQDAAHQRRLWLCPTNCDACESCSRCSMRSLPESKCAHTHVGAATTGPTLATQGSILQHSTAQCNVSAQCCPLALTAWTATSHDCDNQKYVLAATSVTHTHTHTPHK